MKKHPEGRATSPGRSFPLHDFSSATPLGSGSSPLGIRRSGRRPTSGHFLPCLSAWGAISGGSGISFPPPADNSEMRPRTAHARPPSRSVLDCVVRDRFHPNRSGVLERNGMAMIGGPR